MWLVCDSVIFLRDKEHGPLPREEASSSLADKSTFSTHKGLSEGWSSGGELKIRDSYSAPRDAKGQKTKGHFLRKDNPINEV